MFIESVRARATCNTIISSHLVSSHRPCTVGPKLHPLSPSPFPSDFSYPLHFTPRTQYHISFLSFFLSMLGRVLIYSLSSLSPLHPLSSSHPQAVFFLLFSSQSRRFATLSAVLPQQLYRHLPSAPYPSVFTTSIQSYLICRRLPGNQPFARSTHCYFGHLHSFSARRKRNRAELVDHLCRSWIPFFHYSCALGQRDLAGTPFLQDFASHFSRTSLLSNDY